MSGGFIEKMRMEQQEKLSNAGKTDIDGQATKYSWSTGQEHNKVAEAAKRAAFLAAQSLQKASSSKTAPEPEPQIEQKRKFTEDGPTEGEIKPKRVRKSRWDKAEDPIEQLPAPIKEVLEDTKYLKKFDPTKEKDTYDDAVDTGGYIEGGTWEHQKRAEELKATALKAHQATEHAETRESTKSGVASYLPEEALKKFEQQQAMARAQAEFKKMFAANKAKKGNEKRTMDSKPVAPPPVDGSGDTCAPSANDDEFDSYRKRMMLSYRFRPNPMNNPRRGYDGYSTLYGNMDSSGGVGAGDLTDAAEKVVQRK